MSPLDITLTLNGATLATTVPASTTLADLIRGTGATGTHLGCEHGVCGACTVRVDGVATRSCLMLAAQADGCRVETVESLAGEAGMAAAQEALIRHGGLQCGFCTPGVLMTATTELAAGADPTAALAGNLCRCTGYAGIRNAIAETMGEFVEADPSGIRRLEDERLVRGRGSYVADRTAPGMLEVAFVRSTVPHGRIDSLDTTAAAAVPGVVAVLTSAELSTVLAPAGHNTLFPNLAALRFTALAEDLVAFVGDPIAVVVATDRAVAEQAASLVEVSYETLPAIASVAAARAADAPQLWDALEGNVAAFLPNHDPRVPEILAQAPRRVTFEIENHRVAGSPIETVAILAVPQRGVDKNRGRLDVYTTSQSPFMVKAFLAQLLGYPHSDLEVHVGDVGGGFGVKQHLLREELATVAAAVLLDRPVRWIQDRAEMLLAGCHAHESIVRIDAGYDQTGRLLAVDATIDQDLGDPRLVVSGVDPALVTAGFLPNGYDIPAYQYTVTSFVTNKAPGGAYRGYGQPEGNVAIETLMSRIADDLGLDPVEVRHRNLAGSQRPFVTAGGSRLDIGDIHALLDRMVRTAPYEAWKEQRDAARAEGRLLGIGHSVMVEGTATSAVGYLGGMASYEIVVVAILPDGSARVQTASASQGQGHQTMIAAALNSVTGIDPAQVQVNSDGTASLPFGFGTTGSRTAVMTGGAVLAAAEKLVAKAEQIAAYLAETDSAVLDPTTGVFKAGDRSFEWREIAFTAWIATAGLPSGVLPGLTVLETHQAPCFDLYPQADGTFNLCSTYGSAATGILVEVDPDDGHVRILDALIVHDSGRVLHQPSVDGQLVGAFVQGVGMLLDEAVVYDDDANPLVTVMNDYRLPNIAQDFRVRLEHHNTASSIPGGMRGVGEAGIITGSAALFDAISDAVSVRGVRPTSTRLSPGPLLDLLLSTTDEPAAAGASSAG